MSQPDERGDTTQHPAEHPTVQTPTTDSSTSGYAGPPQTQGHPSPPVQYGYGDVQGGFAAVPGHSAPDYGSPVPSPQGFPAPQGYPPNQGYPAPYGYPPYGYPTQRGPIRPGGATASAVLMFIQAALVLFSTFYVLFFASLASSASSAGVSGADSYETEFTIIGILQLVSVGLLIFGGVQLLGGSSRMLTIVACGVQLAFVVYWMIRISSLPDFDVDGTTFFFVVPLMYAVLPLVALPLALARPVTDYLAARAAGSTAAV